MRKSNEQSKRSRYDDKSAEFRGFHAVHVLPLTPTLTRTGHTVLKNAQLGKKNKPTRRGQDGAVDHTGALFE